MDLITGLAIYGAIAATASIAWQWYVRSAGRQLRVEVQVRFPVLTPRDDGTFKPDRFVVVVHNWSDFQIRVRAIHVKFGDGNWRIVVPGLGDADGRSKVVPPQDAFDTADILEVDLLPSPLADPIVAFAELASGEWHASKPREFPSHR